MVKINKIETGFLGVNTYIVCAEGSKECVLIDTGGDYNRIVCCCKELKVAPKAVLLTHGHFDHIGACKDFLDDGLDVYINFADDGFTKCPRLDGFPDVSKFTKPFSCTKYVNDGDILNIAGLKIKVITTPGHSKGSVCYLIDDALFTGDTLFHMSIGRTDFEGGDMGELIASVEKKLFVLSDKRVFPGHGEESSLNFEKVNNPYFQL